MSGPFPDATDRVHLLERREADLLDKLQRCIPPVDQHRAELERVRTELADARAETTGPDVSQRAR